MTAALCAALLLQTTLAGQPSRTLDTPAIIATTKSSVVTLTTLGRAGAANSGGTGFFISVSEDEASDLAILRVARDSSAKPLVLAEAEPAEGERVIVIGSPEGLESDGRGGDHFCDSRTSTRARSDSNQCANLSWFQRQPCTEFKM